MQLPNIPFVKIAASAGLYIALYEATAVLQTVLHANKVAAMIFLPAFVRLLSFLLIGFWSVPALFIAALWCIDLGLAPFQQMVLAMFLAIGGPAGTYLATRQLGIASDLRDLSPGKLLILSLACGLGSSFAYHLGLSAIGFPDQSWMIRIATFTGDVAGTWAIIYIIKTALTALHFPRPN